MIQEIGVVRHLHRFRHTLFAMEIELPGIARMAKPGQFVHLRLEGIPEVLLRRPFSIAEVAEDWIKLIVKIVGTGTAGLAKYKIGRTCDAIGPLGEGFSYDDVEAAYLVGGGIGDAPLLFLQDELDKRGKKTHFFLGARTHKEFPLEDESVSERGIIACTDDGSYGKAGFVTIVFEEHLQGGVEEGATVFSCGPVPMLKAAARICEKYGLPHQVSLENRMGCGVGVCQGCALKLQEGGERGGYRLVCQDGPVFDASSIDWSLIY